LDLSLTLFISLVSLKAVASKKKVSINNFGTFECVHVKSRAGRNPQTGLPLSIPARDKVKFKAYTHLKDYVNKPKN
jgi:nucleoid DNA-binding protein